MRTVKSGVLLLLLWFTFGGCKDKIIVNVCKLSYDQGDLMFISSSSPNIAKPIVNPGAKGVFAADPDGLSIDPNTGEIDINKSATGQKYLVKFISLDNNQICETNVTISGIRYRPDIYNLSNPSLQPLTAIYNANPDNRLPSGGFQQGVNPQGAPVLNTVNVETGAIDLKSINLVQLFGQTGAAANGRSVLVTIKYVLNDDSGGAQNQCTLNFIYYNQESSIPESVREQLKEQQAEFRGGRISGEKGHVPPSVIITEK